MGITITEGLLDTIDNYLKGQLSEEDTIAFQKEMQNNADLAELVLIQQNLFAIQDYKTANKIEETPSIEALEHYKKQIQDEENQKLFQMVKEAGERNKTIQVKAKTYSFAYYIAASIAIVFGAYMYFYANAGLTSYYDTNVNWTELPSYTHKGEDVSNFNTGEILFREKKYEAAIHTFEKINSEDEKYPYALLYLGASYEQLNQNEKAIEYFKKVSDFTNFEEHSRGYWYQLLVHLKMNNSDKAKELKTLILKDTNNYNYEKVKELNF